jgi:putative ABC transport system substrate-binding protein
VLGGKRLGLLRELIPSAGVIGVLLYPNARDIETQLNDIRAAAQAIDQRILVLNVATEQDAHGAFRTLAQARAGALLFGNHPFFTARKELFITLAAHYALPAIYGVREEAVAGGLMSYGTSLPDAYRLAGVYTGRILKGEKPSELPVMQSTKFEFVINLKTAKTLGLTLPSGLLSIADEVIE